jgi:DNA-binding NarL/FixJ family response regulator
MASQLKPDVIVLDFVMPMLNGMEAAREILKAMPSVPIVLYTLHKNPQLELDASELGICKVISKGEDSNALIAILQELLASSETPLKPIGLPPRVFRQTSYSAELGKRSSKTNTEETCRP